MKILLNNNDLNEALNNVSNLGFIPTMGSLHKGHISLIKKSQKICKKTIVSIFVNPLQFNNLDDYKKYPRNNKKDLSILRKLKVNYVFVPKQKNIYAKRKFSKINIAEKDKILCAKYRKGHFEGVIDVMSRLTNLINPTKIFMGEKDFQQFYLVKKYIKKKYRSKIFLCKTIRDKNKVALSSRNFHLNKTELLIAGKIAKKMFSLKKKIKKQKNLNTFLSINKKELSKQYNITVEYLELRNSKDLKISNKFKDSKIFIAYYLNKTRLIDNF